MQPHPIYLEAIARRCERASKQFDEDPLATMIRLLDDAIQDVGRSSSQSWLGYQSTVYLHGFRPAVGGERFDSMWGKMSIYDTDTSSDWVCTDYEDVRAEIQRRANAPDLKAIDVAAEAAEEVFSRNRSELLPLRRPHFYLRRLRTQRSQGELSKLSSHTSQQVYVKYLSP